MPRMLGERVDAGASRCSAQAGPASLLPGCQGGSPGVSSEAIFPILASCVAFDLARPWSVVAGALPVAADDEFSRNAVTAGGTEPADRGHIFRMRRGACRRIEAIIGERNRAADEGGLDRRPVIRIGQLGRRSGS